MVPPFSICDQTSRFFLRETMELDNSRMNSLIESYGSYPMYGATMVNQNEYTLHSVVRAWSQSHARNPNIQILSTAGQSMRIRTATCPQGFAFGIEKRRSNCSAPMPYVTGVYALPRWMPAVDRPHTLTFIGSTWRASRKRSQLVRGLQRAGRAHMPLLIASHRQEAAYGWAQGNVSMLAKSQYGISRFSLHPRGDSLTRRSFYESLLMGCIPVVEKVAYDSYYSKVLPGVPTPFVIALDESTFYNTNLLLAHLDRIPPKSIEHLQRRMREVARLYTFAFEGASFWDVVAWTADQRVPFVVPSG